MYYNTEPLNNPINILIPQPTNLNYFAIPVLLSNNTPRNELTDFEFPQRYPLSVIECYYKKTKIDDIQQLINLLMQNQK